MNKRIDKLISDTRSRIYDLMDNEDSNSFSNVLQIHKFSNKTTIIQQKPKNIYVTVSAIAMLVIAIVTVLFAIHPWNNPNLPGGNTQYADDYDNMTQTDVLDNLSEYYPGNLVLSNMEMNYGTLFSGNVSGQPYYIRIYYSNAVEIATVTIVLKSGFDYEHNIAGSAFNVCDKTIEMKGHTVYYHEELTDRLTYALGKFANSEGYRFYVKSSYVEIPEATARISVIASQLL